MSLVKKTEKKKNCQVIGNVQLHRMNTFCLDHPWQRHTLDTRNDFQDAFWNESDGVSRVIDGDGYCGLIGEIADGVTQGELMYLFCNLFFATREILLRGFNANLSMTRDRQSHTSHSILCIIYHSFLGEHQDIFVLLGASWCFA